MNLNKMDIIQILLVVLLLIALAGLILLAYAGKTDANALQTFIINTIGVVVTAILSWVAASRVKEQEGNAKRAVIEAQNESLRAEIATLEHKT